MSVSFFPAVIRSGDDSAPPWFDWAPGVARAIEPRSSSLVAASQHLFGDGDVDEASEFGAYPNPNYDERIDVTCSGSWADVLFETMFPDASRGSMTPCGNLPLDDFFRAVQSGIVHRTFVAGGQVQVSLDRLWGLCDAAREYGATHITWG